VSELTAGPSTTPQAGPRHAPLPADEVARLHEAALELLAARGLPVAGATARALFEAAGASSDGATGRIRLPADLVRRALTTAPASFVLPGRTADRDAVLGGRRGGLLAALAAAPDIAAAALLADALSEVAAVGLPTRRLAELPDVLAATAKPVLVCGALSAAQAAAVIAVAAAVGGREGAPRAPLGVVVHTVAQTELDPLLDCARAGLVCSFLAAPLCDEPLPDRAAALVALHAAALGACAAQQLAAPGSPYLVPALPATVEEHAPGYGLGPAGVATFAQLAQLARHVGLPIAAGFAPSRPAADEWLAAADGTAFALAAALGGAALLAGAGQSDDGAVFSPVQLVLDAETWSNVAAVGAGITVDDETIALETIAAIGIGGNALAQRHTRRHMKDVWRPRLFDRSAFEAWDRDGRPGAPGRAAALADELCLGREVPPLDAEKRATLRRIIATAGL
jgi:trimethylamine---corrinoid protein Co-methyltransferase